MLKVIFQFRVWWRVLSRRAQALIIVSLLVLAAGVTVVSMRAKPAAIEQSSQSQRTNRYYPTEAQWETLTIEPVEQSVFRSELVTEGKIAVDEDRSTPIFSPYAGRVTKLLAKPGDQVQRGQPLFIVEATDTVQALNDFIIAMTAMNKARSQLDVAKIVEKRHRELYESNAVALKELEQAQVALVSAQNDMRSSETALEAARNRLRILGRTDEEIAVFQDKGKISPETPIYAPIGGTVVQRKVGPGQYVGSGSSDPVFVIGDLSTVWLLAYIRETEAPNVRDGQALSFSVLAYPDQIFPANISYVATALDLNTRRLLVRATVNNSKGLLKPEMFASVKIFTGEGDSAPSIPRDAIIYEGNIARVWIAHDDKGIELRQIKPGLASGRIIQVLDGLKPGEKVITKGSLFIDRAAAGS